MKELLTEQQADGVVLVLSILATLASLGFGLYQSRSAQGETKRFLWASALLFALTGPAIWIFWGIYNSIEDQYGLDSVKALEINFGIVVGIAFFFVVAHALLRRWIPEPKPQRSRS